MARISATFFRATATAPLFFTLAPPRRAPPFLVRASGAVALKVAQVPSTAFLCPPSMLNKFALSCQLRGHAKFSASSLGQVM